MGPAMIYLKASAKLVQTFEYSNSLRYFLLFLFFSTNLPRFVIQYVDLFVNFVAKFSLINIFNYFLVFTLIF